MTTTHTNSLILFMLMAVCYTTTNAQQTLNAATVNARSAGYVFTGSVGEMCLVSTQRNSRIIITQGFLQPGTVKIPSGGGTAPGALPELYDLVKVYPNPTHDFIYVETTEAADVQISYQVYDALGRLIFSKSVFQKKGFNKVEMDLKAWAAGAYYLILQKPDETGKPASYTFKIIKAN